MFEGFTRTEIETSGARIHLRHGGKGPPLLLLHGNPLTHVSWHGVANRLAEHFHVVCPDLRGYGDSVGPEDGGENHINYSFRAMALDQVEVMERLGYREFMVAGHDRGARTTARMCLDHPDRVRRAALVDILPNYHIWTHTSKQWATKSWHWLFMIQPYDMPERMMAVFRRRFTWNGNCQSLASGLDFFTRRHSPNTSAASIGRPSAAHARITVRAPVATSRWTRPTTRPGARSRFRCW